MNLYDRFVLPRIVHFTCSRRPNMRQRAKVVPAASGRVLEIGFGSGLNLPFYDSALVQRLWALDPAEEMWALAREKANRAAFPVEFLKASAEEVPLPDHTVDTVVVTYTLCTVPDAQRALAQIARVLRPNGRLLFCEHGLAPDEGTRKWQRRMNPLWKRLGGGCHLDRDIPALLSGGGFRELELATMYLPGWKPASYNYWGRAVPCG
ncbi:MAG TPA: methyltransferase domain-containing protein [Thermoanaerobaculia bacterium]|nr:methyltransferase domain-containing protein [Thermoanaerobaculia bacterium]